CCNGSTMRKCPALFHETTTNVVSCEGYPATSGAAVPPASGGLPGIRAPSPARDCPRRKILRKNACSRLSLLRVKIISMEGVTISVSTVAKARPKTMVDESAIHHWVDGALM